MFCRAEPLTCSVIVVSHNSSEVAIGFMLRLLGSRLAAGLIAGRPASLSGFKLGALLAGVSAVVTNNTINRAIELNIQ